NYSRSQLMQELCLLVLLGLILAQGDAYHRLRQAIKCRDRPHLPHVKVHGNYWVLFNYIRADHGDIQCHAKVTYTTHADFRFLDNVMPLAKRWQAPISAALYAPGADFEPTVERVLWLRQCSPERELIRQWVSFHIYFHVNHSPGIVPNEETLAQRTADCTETPKFAEVPRLSLYRKEKHMRYPVNVGRNVARDASLTHYVLVSDIELYPSPNLANGFLQMLRRNRQLLRPTKRIVYPLNIFEVTEESKVPNTKPQLQYLLYKGNAVSFHSYICPSYHNAPRLQEWINAIVTSDRISVFHVSNRTKEYKFWEPIYIGTVNDPPYDDSLSWEGMSDKLTQAYALCVLGYEFHILENAFLVHKPGIKTSRVNRNRMALAYTTYDRLLREIPKQFGEKYGYRDDCSF
ncbi:hypothetical protein KR222_008816, partial [Zaprionus bogoriensis]